jgi:hypothetical protein
MSHNSVMMGGDVGAEGGVLIFNECDAENL